MPEGTLALTWNTRDESTSFARRLGSLLQRVQPVPGHGDWATRSVTAVADCALFGPLGYAEFSLVQHITRDQLVRLVASRSYVIALPEARRAELLDEVGRLFDANADFVTERGSGELSVALPYRTQCWRTVRR